LNINNFKIIEAMGLKILHGSPFELHYLRIKVHEILPRGSKVIIGEHTGRETDW
jgi:hypothetical protein